MHQVYTTEGFVFKKTDSKEADRVFSVFTQDFGRLEVTGRGIRKIASKLKGGIEVFSLSRVEFVQGKTHRTLIDTSFIKKFKYISQSSKKQRIALRVGNLLDRFLKGSEPDEAIWNLTVNFFEKLNNPLLVVSSQQPFYYFFWNFISVLGYGPQLSHCVICKQILRPNPLYFSASHGGIICSACYINQKEGLIILPDTIKLMRLMTGGQVDAWETVQKIKISESIQKELQAVSKYYYIYLLSHYSRP